MRLTGILVGLGSLLPAAKSCRIKHLDGDGELGPSFEAMRKHLRSTRAPRQLVGAIDHPSALGALRAFQEAGRSECCAIMGHNAAPEGRVEQRQPNTRLLGSVAFFPERHGEDLIRGSLDILNRRAVPPAGFVEHKLIAPGTVDHFYPNDSLTQADASRGGLPDRYSQPRSITHITDLAIRS
jgi:ribose transport system substrate-binding protein